MTDAEIERVAKGLTEAQRRCIKTPFRGFLHNGDVGSARSTTYDALARRGVLNDCDRLTPLGLAVRSYLQEQAK